MKKSVIVKVQVPLFSNASDGGQALVYPEDRSWQTFFPVTETLLKNLKGEPKGYFHATVSKGEVSINSAAPWQEW